MDVMKSKLCAALVSALLCIAATSCGSSQRVVQGGAGSSHSYGQTVPAKPLKPVAIPSAATPSMAALVGEANGWLGTRYLYGGNTRDGIDCSGLVLAVYLKALDIKLPRTSAQQQQFCRTISKRDMRPGDLIFFTVRGGSNVGHVGIYVGDGNMIHASSSKGVIVTPISNDYFVRNFHSCGRVEAYERRLVAESAKPAPAQPAAHVMAQETPAQPEVVASVTPAPQSDPAAIVPTPQQSTPMRTVRIAKTKAPNTSQSVDDDFFD